MMEAPQFAMYVPKVVEEKKIGKNPCSGAACIPEEDIKQ